MRLAVIALAAWLANSSSTFACACCSNEGHRHVASVAFDSGKREEIASLRSGHSGTLSLTKPKAIAIFEVDPRNRPDQGRGPSLYKEWRLTTPATGTGIFRAGLGRRQSLSLILHGGGNDCTSAMDFTHWTLVMQGPKANYMLFGGLVTAQ